MANELPNKGSDPIDSKEDFPLLPGKVIEAEVLEECGEVCGFNVVVPREIMMMAFGVFCFRSFHDSFQRLAIQYYTKDNLHWSPAASGVLMQVVTGAWNVKPLWGYISDTFPIFGYHRISYIATSLVLVMLGNLGILMFPDTTLWFLIFATGASSAMCIVFMAGEALLSEQSKHLKMAAANKMLTLSFATGSLGSLVGGAIGGQVQANLGYQWVFGLSVFLPLVALGFVWRPKLERPRDPQESQRTCQETASLICTVFSNPMMYMMAIFLLLNNATPSMGQASFYFYTNELKISEEWMSLLSVADSVFGLVGFGLYYKFFSAKPPRWMMFWGTLITTLLTSSTLLLYTGANRAIGIPDVAFLFLDDVIVVTIGGVLSCPLLSIIAQMCPKGLEGTVFCTFTTIYNLGLLLGSAATAWSISSFGVTEKNFDNIVELRVFTLLIKLLPITIVFLLPSKKQLDVLSEAADPPSCPEIPPNGGSSSASSDDIGRVGSMQSSCCVVS